MAEAIKKIGELEVKQRIEEMKDKLEELNKRSEEMKKKTNKKLKWVNVLTGLMGVLLMARLGQLFGGGLELEEVL